MSILLYSNGIVDEIHPKNLVFTESELLSSFVEFENVKTFRLSTVLNAWCIYGVSLLQEAIEYNRIATELIKEPIYSHVLLVHDSELNLEWKVTDSILYKGYNEFHDEIIKLINELSGKILRDYQAFNGDKNSTEYLPQLVSIGTTEDKRILFNFNPDDQTREFYDHEEFYVFSQKVYDFLNKNKQEKEPFTIYADKKAIIIIDSNNVKTFLNSMLEKFKNKEEYEICTNITKMIKQWPPTKKTRKKGITKNKNS